MSAGRTTKTSRRKPEVPTRGRANFAKMDAMTEEDIMRTSPPELRDLPPDFWTNPRYRPASGGDECVVPIDIDVVAWFERQGPKPHARMNAVLRAHMLRAGKRKRGKRGAA